MKSNPIPESPPLIPPGQPSFHALALEPYFALVRELAALVAALRGLWKQREELGAKLAEIVAERTKIGRALHKIQGASLEKRGPLEKSLEGVNYRHSLKAAEIEGCDLAISEAELALHAKYPLANATFQRLYSALGDWTFLNDYQALLALMHPKRLGLTPEIPLQLMPIERTVSSSEFAAMTGVQRAQVQKDPDGRLYIMETPFAAQINPPEPTLEELAQKMARSALGTVELAELTLPSCWVQSLFDDGIVKWSAQRKDTMLAVCRQADLLCERAIAIMARAGQAEGFRVPEFKLGADIEPPLSTDVPLEWLNGERVTYHSAEEIRAQFVWKGQAESPLSEHMEELLRDAGKTRGDLDEAIYQVLVHSEVLQNQSGRVGREFLSGSRAVATL
jgi:hypothetical protein